MMRSVASVANYPLAGGALNTGTGTGNGSGSGSGRRRPRRMMSCWSSGKIYIPKLEPFNQSVWDRIINNPPLIQKTKNQLTDYCSTLEGEPCCSCWMAYFELEELQKEMSKEELERLITEAEGVESLVGYVHRKTEIRKARNQLPQNPNPTPSPSPLNHSNVEERVIPDGIPKSLEDMEEQEMPDNILIRMLRCKGRFPAHYTRPHSSSSL